MSGSLSTDNEVFRVYLAYSALAVLKLLAMSSLTSFNRVSRKVYDNLEDAKLGGPDAHKFVRKDPFIERIRRCHLNDLENIVPFLIIGILYVLTGPSVYAATWHFRIFVVSRFIHMFAYLAQLPQPSRVTAMYIGWCATASMAVQCLQAGQY
ncbi:microsomal glutathione S-transferase 1-like [Amphiura filiformis]|uniref:microsomal glutathione S-transferase 1-like n=1 Tax=Amphiura filiformis TaxID=82378 RepID=UPI003B215B94